LITGTSIVVRKYTEREREGGREGGLEGNEREGGRRWSGGEKMRII